uniref:FZ domain-containing protein n=1 Tax=Macrostomum lignano TaxID=282301 RepID=A0A1I8HYM5_9PLAT
NASTGPGRKHRPARALTRLADLGQLWRAVLPRARRLRDSLPVHPGLESAPPIGHCRGGSQISGSVPAASLANGANNLGYCVLRFDRPRDCARALAALRSLSAADLANLCCPAGPAYFTLCRMDDICCLPPFQFPCHNLLPWHGRRFPEHARALCLESWQRPFRCICHPNAASYSPASVDQLIRLSRLIRIAGSPSNSACSPEGLRDSLSELLEAAESDLAESSQQ